VYDYIEQNFKKEDEDFVYCKILMETLANEKGRALVENLLGRVCQL
jgi:hypothetical protein